MGWTKASARKMRITKERNKAIEEANALRNKTSSINLPGVFTKPRTNYKEIAKLIIEVSKQLGE